MNSRTAHDINKPWFTKSDGLQEGLLTPGKDRKWHLMVSGRFMSGHYCWQSANKEAQRKFAGKHIEIKLNPMEMQQGMDSQFWRVLNEAKEARR